MKCITDKTELQNQYKLYAKQGILCVDGGCTSVALLSKTLLQIIFYWFLTLNSAILKLM